MRFVFIEKETLARFDTYAENSIIFSFGDSSRKRFASVENLEILCSNLKNLKLSSENLWSSTNKI